MSIDTLKELLPDYAKDIKLNLSSLANEEILTDQQKWGTFLASAMAGRNATVIKAVEAEASQHLSTEALTAAKAAASIMAMNNVYYRFVHLAANKEYQTLPAKLRMNVIGAPGIEKADFELYSLAVSAINGCGMCIDAHEAQLLKEGLSKDAIQASIRIGATIQAVSTVLDTESALDGTTALAAAAE
ncbi:MAG: alkyl hydroperoxide reductase [Micavibrio sp.]|nr:alkyl hydroperoxide reductase [Micavibrio sp.]